MRHDRQVNVQANVDEAERMIAARRLARSTLQLVEQEFDVHSLRCGDVHVWPLVRIALYEQLDDWRSLETSVISVRLEERG